MTISGILRDFELEKHVESPCFNQLGILARSSTENKIMSQNPPPIDQLKSENQKMVDEQKILEQNKTIAKTEPVESIEFTKIIEELEAKNKGQAAEIQEFKSEVTELKEEIKTLIDRLNAKRKSIENSEKTSDKYQSS